MTGRADTAEGEVLEISELGGDFQTRAVVRGAVKGADHIQRLHLEFLERPAPPRLSGSSADWSPPGGAPAAPATPPPAPPPRAARPTPTPTAAPARQNVRAKPPRTPPTAQATGSDTLDALQKEILDTYQGLKDRSYYNLLGIERGATQEEIKAAYSKLARQFHPDRVGQNGLEGMKTPANSIFIRLGEARSILTDRDERAWYDRKNPTLSPKRNVPEKVRQERPAQTPKATQTPKTPQAPKATQTVQAPQETETPPSRPPAFGDEDVAAVIADAKALFKSEKYWDVIQKLEDVLPLVKQATQKQAILLLLARATIKNPNWLRRGEEILRQIVQENPKNVEAHLLLGNIYRDGGLKARAVREYQAILQVDPGHTQATRAVAALKAKE